MAKQFIVARGQIERGLAVIASAGEAYKPKNAAEEKRLLDAGVIAEGGGVKKRAATDPAKLTTDSAGSANDEGDTGSTSDAGTGGGDGGAGGAA